MGRKNYLEEANNTIPYNKRRDSVCAVLRSYMSPVPVVEGRSQVAKNLIDSIRSIGLKIQCFSVGLPFTTTDNGFHVFRKINTYTFGISDFVYPSFLERFALSDFLMAAILLFLKAPLYKLIYLLNVHPLPYSTLFKLLYKSTGAHHPIVIAHLFHSPEYERIHNIGISYALLDRLLCTNKRLASFLSKTLNEGKVCYVPPPVNVDEFKPIDRDYARRSLNLPSDTTIIGYVGHLTFERGIFDAVRAYYELNDKKSLLIIVTPPNFPKRKGTDTHEITHFINRFGLKNKVRVINEYMQMNLFYNAIDILVAPFRQPYQPTDPPMVILEALSSGTPLVTTPVGAIREVVDESRALFVRPGDVEGLKDAIEYLMDNEKEREKLGRNARKYVIENLSLEVIGRKLKKIFEEILEHG